MKDVIIVAVYVSVQLYNPNICLHVKGTFCKNDIPHAVCCVVSPYHDMRLLLHLLLMNVWMVPLVFETENSVSIFPKNKL